MGEVNNMSASPMWEMNDTSESFFKVDFLRGGSVPEVRGDEYHKAEEFFECFVLFLSPLVVIGNVIVFVSASLAARQRGREPRVVYLALGTVASADFLICLALWFELFEINNMNHKFYCAVKLGSVISGSLTSMLSICLIAVERFLYVVHGIKYDSFLTPARTGLLICLVWITGLGFGLVPILLEAHWMESDYVEVCEFIKSPRSVIVTAAALAVPALVLTPLVYTAVYCHARKLAAKIRTTEKIPSLKFRSILVVFLSSVSFLLCWGPFILACAVFKLYCEPAGLECRGLELAVVSPLACLGFANSLLNPLIYAWWHPPYHTALKRVICPNAGRAKGRASLYERPTNVTCVQTIT